MKVIQIVGYKNSGKTTISREIITYFTGKGIKVASLKNHGHGGIPIGIENTDSEQHRAAGSSVAGVLGENVLQFSHKEKWEIADIIAIYQQLKIELLIIEGFKNFAFPKIVLLRDQDDITLLANVSNVIGVLKASNAHINESDIHFPLFDMENPSIYCDWVYQHYWVVE